LKHFATMPCLKNFRVLKVPVSHFANLNHLDN
jgi:hypothetical protein